MILEIIIILVAFYFFTMFILAPLFVPNLGWKRKINEKLPVPLIRDMEQIGRKYVSREEVARAVVAYQLKFVYSKLANLYSNLDTVFDSSFSLLWKRKRSLHCHQQNAVLRNLLLATGRFKDSEIRLKLSVCYVQIHQYVVVNLHKGKSIKVDPYAMSIGFDYGEILPFRVYSVLKKRGIKY